jgi:hypothetical protein
MTKISSKLDHLIDNICSKLPSGGKRHDWFQRHIPQVFALILGHHNLYFVVHGSISLDVSILLRSGCLGSNRMVNSE